MNLPNEVKKYLEKFASDKWKIEKTDSRLFNTIVVIPAIEEYRGIQSLLDSLILNSHEYLDKVLFIFVINNTAVVPESIKQDNVRSLSLIRDIITKNQNSAEIKKVIGSGINLAVVDASSEGNEFPEKEGGVGLARKIGMDLALRYFNYENGGKNLLVCLDGDCIVDNNYLEVLCNINVFIKSGFVQYRHSIPEDKESKLAIICYEIFLRYYVLGLTVAESPYAFHTIGSTLFCDADSYVKVQGMNKRKAAEDFYFIEKLSKINTIHEIKDTTVYPSARPSWRVPFGTGQRVRRYLEKEQDEYTLYSFKSFLVLKEWLKVFMGGNTNTEHLLAEAKRINKSLYTFLIDQKFQEGWNKILEHTHDETQIFRQKKYWFDGFRTLKLIHYLRDNEFPNEFMFDVLDEALKRLGLETPEREKNQNIPEIDIQLKYLSILRDHY